MKIIMLLVLYQFYLAHGAVEKLFPLTVYENGEASEISFLCHVIHGLLT